MKKLVLLIIVLGQLSHAEPLKEPTRTLPPGAYTATTEPQDMTIINSGMASFEKRLQMIESAHKNIDAEFFIYNKDHAGRIFTNALIKKAHEGVRVRLIVDAAPFVVGLNKYDADILIREGIEVRFYNNVSLGHADKIQFRSHRKSFVIDGEQFINGGRNIADEYFEMSAEYNFMDRDIYVRGSLAQAVQQSFEDFWKNSYTTKPEAVKKPEITDYGFKSEKDAQERSFNSNHDLQVYQHYKNDLYFYNKKTKEAQDFLVLTDEDKKILAHIRDHGPVLLALSARSVCTHSYFISDKPGVQDKDRVLFDQLLNLIGKSKTSLFMETPYFVLTKKDQLLQNMLKHNFSIQLLTNSLYSTDSLLTIADFYPRIEELTQLGAEVYIYKGDSPNWLPDLSNPEASKARWGTHAKGAVIDGDTIVIASFNIDPRSENINSEMAVICRDNEYLANKLLENFNQRISQAVVLNKEGNPSDGRSKYFDNSFWKLVMYRLEYPIAQVFDFLL